MGRKPNRTGPAKQEEPESLFRVFRADTDQPVYLPSGKGILREDAERLSAALVIETYIKRVWPLSETAEEGDS
jgi:hypothetical protein